MRPLLALLFLLAPLAVAQDIDFTRSVWPVLEKAQCRQCHSDDGVASTTRLQFPVSGASASEIAAFGTSLRRFVTPASITASPLYTKPTQRIPHGGGERIRRDSPEDAALLAWVTHLAKLPESAGQANLRKNTGESKPVLRRLTHSQYNHTVRDLLGEETRPADQFPKEDFVHGFTNQADGQSISPLLAEAYSRAAERLARVAFSRGDSRKLIPCKTTDPACRVEFIRTFGRKAYRRPLTSEEVARFEKLFLRESGFLQGAQVVVEAMLQSPHFLFHLEPGPYAVASRLSYFLWDTMPDEPLLSAAARGDLASHTDIEQHARRMLADPRARSAFDEFLAQWLRFDRLRGALRDRRLFPEYSPELVSLMIEETTRLFRSLVWDNGNFMEFYSAGYSYLVPELARLYNVDPPQEPWAKVAYPSGAQRAGIVGQASFLTVTSKPAETSPTERGLFVREHFLCQQVPPPPPGVNATLPPVTDEKPITQRERLGEHLSNQVCAGCHSLVDPIGFGFEHFDAIGRFRQKELIVIYPSADDLKTRRKTKPSEFQLPIEAGGSIRGIANSDFSNPAALGAILARDPNCQKCVVKQLFRYAIGRHEGPEDAAVIEKALARFQRSQFRFQELIMSIVSSDPFRGD
jgi:mono/diheme cytochrome c family protein